jgi:hypothetical protein
MTHDPFTPGEAAATADEEDPIVEECIRDALGPYGAALSPEELADYRKFLSVFITTHPAAAPLHQRLRKRKATVASGEVEREGDGAEEAAAVRSDGTFGGPR